MLPLLYAECPSLPLFVASIITRTSFLRGVPSLCPAQTQHTASRRKPPRVAASLPCWRHLPWLLLRNRATLTANPLCDVYTSFEEKDITGSNPYEKVDWGNGRQRANMLTTDKLRDLKKTPCELAALAAPITAPHRDLFSTAIRPSWPPAISLAF